MKVCFWSTTFQSDVQCLAHYLTQQPGVEVLVAMNAPERYDREAIARVLPFHGRVIDRKAATARGEIERFGADVVIIDNHLPSFRIAKRMLVLWHGFGWRVDDLAQMRRDLRKHVGDVTKPNANFRWQAFGDWDRRYRIEHSQLAPDNVLALGSAFSDWLLPNSALRGSFDRDAVQADYTIDLSRPTLLLALTWHHGGSLGHWGDESDLLDRLLRHIEARGANTLLRMHDRYRYEPTYLATLERLVNGRASVQLKYKSSSPDSLVDQLVSAAMISNYSSILNGFYHTRRPTLHIDPADTTGKAQYYRRWKSGRVQSVRVKDPQRIWKLDPGEHGGLRAQSFDELLSAVDLALSDPGCCEQRALDFCRRYISAADGRTCERITRMLHAWLA